LDAHVSVKDYLLGTYGIFVGSVLIWNEKLFLKGTHPRLGSHLNRVPGAGQGRRVTQIKMI